MRILVTGATGFIGLNLLERLLRTGHDVTALALDEVPPLPRAAFGTLPGRVRYAMLDVRDRDALDAAVRTVRPEAIIAAAAITAGIARERAAPADILETNLVATLRTIETAARYDVARVVCFSSTAALGERIFGARPISETEGTAPSTLYGISKAAIEASASRWNMLAAVPSVRVVRLAAVFGPWERESGVRDSLSPLHHIAREWLAHRPIAPLPSGGERDWVYAPYVAEVVEWLATSTAPTEDLYNVSAGCVWHPRLFVQALADEGVRMIEMQDGAPIPFNDDVARRRSPLDVSRISAAFGAPPDPATATRAFARWVVKHWQWYGESFSKQEGTTPIPPTENR